MDTNSNKRCEPKRAASQEPMQPGREFSFSDYQKMNSCEGEHNRTQQFAPCCGGGDADRVVFMPSCFCCGKYTNNSQPVMVCHSKPTCGLPSTALHHNAVPMQTASHHNAVPTQTASHENAVPMETALHHNAVPMQTTYQHNNLSKCGPSSSESTSSGQNCMITARKKKRVGRKDDDTASEHCSVSSGRASTQRSISSHKSRTSITTVRELRENVKAQCKLYEYVDKTIKVMDAAKSDERNDKNVETYKSNTTAGNDAVVESKTVVCKPNPTSAEIVKTTHEFTDPIFRRVQQISLRNRQHELALMEDIEQLPEQIQDLLQ